jgi:hypothetical protein
MGPMAGGSRAAEAAAAAAAAAGVQGLGQQQQDVAVESPLERRRSGYRSSMRKVGDCATVYGHLECLCCATLDGFMAMVLPLMQLLHRGVPLPSSHAAAAAAVCFCLTESLQNSTTAGSYMAS